MGKIAASMAQKRRPKVAAASVRVGFHTRLLDQFRAYDSHQYLNLALSAYAGACKSNLSLLGGRVRTNCPSGSVDSLRHVPWAATASRGPVTTNRLSRPCQLRLLSVFGYPEGESWEK